MAATEGRDPYEDYLLINKELEEFNPKLLKKPQIIIANKMDVDTFSDNLDKFIEKLNNKDIKIFKVSAATNKGLTEVIDALAEILDNTPDAPLFDEDEFESHVLYKFKKEEPYTIDSKKMIYVISGDEIEKLFKMTKFSSEEGMLRFAKKLRRMGIDDKLKELGAKEGDQVRILDFILIIKIN